MSLLTFSVLQKTTYVLLLSFPWAFTKVHRIKEPDFNFVAFAIRRLGME
jgi:hypothetical protein